MSFFVPHFGYTPDRQYTQRFVSGLPYPRLATHLPHLLRQRTKRDVNLLEPLVAVKPTWRRGAQGIGDCVSWGAEIVATALMAMQHVTGESGWVEEAATEAIYGGCRVEALGERTGGWDDGAAGSWAAKWLHDFGVLLRIDYSQETGNPDHDLRKYDGRDSREGRAKRWGYYGCGGESDSGKLDAVAKKFPVREVTLVKTVEEAEAAIDAGCPITVASQVGYGNMERNADGVVRRSGSWAHQMAILGKRYTPGGSPLFLQVQSWGKSCSGPAPGMTEAMAECCWWTTPEDLALQLRDEDSYAFSRIAGFTQPPWDFHAHFFV